MSKLKLTIDRAIIDGGKDNGYCYIARKEENGGEWIEIHGNMSAEQASGDYPLCLDSIDDIDEFAKHLKTILNK